jgi:hypothetical protein
MSGHIGARRPCKICGKPRQNEPRNAENAAVCRRCYPAWIRYRFHSAHLSLYLGKELKAHVLREAQKRRIPVHQYVRIALQRRIRIPKSEYPN